MQCVSHKRRHDPGRVVQEDQAVAERKTAARKFLQGKKIFFLKILVPRNNKLSQVTVCIYIYTRRNRHICKHVHTEHIYIVLLIHHRIYSRILRMGGRTTYTISNLNKTNKLKIVQSEKHDNRQLRQTLFSSRWRTRVISNEIVN